MFKKVKSSSEALPNILILLAALVFFLLKFDLNVLDVTHSNWIYNLSFDPRTEIISWNYYRHTPWSFPIIGRLEGYDYPTVTGSAMTGIVSPLAVPFKVFSNWLPDEFQYFGWWFLLCYLLQGYFGLKLINATGQRSNVETTQNTPTFGSVYQSSYTVRVLAAIFFILSPPFLMRTGHMHMFSHFFILAALAQYFDKNRTPFQKFVYFALLSSLCVGVSQYTTAMVMGIGLAAFVDMAYRRLMPFYRIFTDGSGVLLAVLFVYYILGGFLMPFATSQFVGFGSYASNLNTFFNPLEHSKIYATLALSDAGQYEGFGYLGVGFLGLILSSVLYAIGSKIYTLAKRRKAQNPVFQPSNASISSSRRLVVSNFPLLFMALVFFVYALSCKIGWNEKLIYEWHYDATSAMLFESLRASGRFIWVPVYVIMTYALAYFLKMPLSNGVKTGVLVAFLGLQVYDIQKLLTFDKSMFERCTAENCTHHVWKPMLSEASRLVVFPLYTWDIKSSNDFFFFARMASEVGKGITTGYFARRNVPLTVEYERKAYKDWAADDLGENEKAVFIGNKQKMWRFKKLVETGKLLPFEYEGYGILVPPSLKKTLNFLKNLPNCRPLPFYTEGVAEVFKRHEKNTIFVTACEEAFYQLDATTRAAFEQTGAKDFSKMGFAGAYMGIIHKGKTVFEAVDNEKKLERTFETKDLLRLFNQTDLKFKTVVLASSGVHMGKDSKTIIDGKEHSPNRRGLNFVVVNKDFEVVETLNFDTYAENYHAIFK